MADTSRNDEFVEQWRDNAYGCFSSGHKFCREVCPVMQVTRNENHTPTAFHASIVAMEKGLVGVEDVADDFVHCTQCGACELRCPNTLMTGDFYRHRTRTVDVVKAMRALMVETGNEREGWRIWNERLAEDHNEPVLGETRVLQEHVADWAIGLDIPIGGETILFVDCEAAFYRTSYTRAFAQLLQKGGVEFGLMREQWCCGGPAAEMGYVDLARKHADHNVADWRAVGAKRIIAPDPHDFIAFTEDYPKYFGDDYEFEIVLGVELVNDLVQEGKIELTHAGRAHGHLPRPVPAEQAQGRAQGAARAAARGPRHHVPRRRPRHAVVLLLRRRRRAADREARDHRGDQPPARREGQAVDAGSTRSSAPARGRSARCPRPARRRASTSRPVRAGRVAGIEVGDRSHDRRLQERDRRRRHRRAARRSSATTSRVLPDISSRAFRARVPAPFPVHRWADHMPDVAILPKTAQEVSEVVKLANRLQDPDRPARRRHRALRRRRPAARRHPRRRQADEPDPRDRPRGPHRDRRAGHQHAQAQRGAQAATASSIPTTRRATRAASSAGGSAPAAGRCSARASATRATT